ncbi:MAG: co-chaperone GroES [Pseudomonadota bacterium]
MHIKPLYDRLLVKPLAAETRTRSGIVIPDQATEKSNQGEVLAVGDGALLENGELRPLAVKVGDRVLYSEYAGTEIKIEGEKHLVIREADVHAVLEASPAQEKAA